jgi:plasmid stability protein
LPRYFTQLENGNRLADFCSCANNGKDKNEEASGPRFPEYLVGGRENVQEHQNTFQFRTAGYAGGGSSGFAAIREKNQWIQQAVEGKRGCVRGCHRRDSEGFDAAAAVAGNDRAAKESGRRGRESEGARGGKIWRLSWRGRPEKTVPPFAKSAKDGAPGDWLERQMQIPRQREERSLVASLCRDDNVKQKQSLGGLEARATQTPTLRKARGMAHPRSSARNRREILRTAKQPEEWRRATQKATAVRDDGVKQNQSLGGLEARATQTPTVCKKRKEWGTRKDWRKEKATRRCEARGGGSECQESEARAS